MDLIERLAYYHDISGLPMVVYDGGQAIKSFIAATFAPDIALMIVSAIMDGSKDNKSKNMDVTLSEDFVIAGYVRESASGLLVVAGPVLEFPCDWKLAQRILCHIKEPMSRTDEILSFFKRQKSFSLSRFSRNMVFLNSYLNGEGPPENYVDEKITSLLGPEFDDYIKSKKEVQHDSQSMEQVLLSLVERGKEAELVEILRNERKIPGNMGVTANDSIRAYKNIFVSSVTLISRAAIKGGLDYETALDASDTYQQKMETLSTQQEVHELWRQMFLDYTKKVAKIKRFSSSSNVVNKALGYVEDHIYGKLTVSGVAEAMGYSCSYVCRVFKSDTGKTLSDCINEARIEEAKHLLIATDKSIVDISLALGFSTQSYFQTTFKKYAGMTPAKFRTVTRP
ncbi:MAG: AraC family transcriptional regulator [Clostridiales bacterium]|jgi:YesN/AraC family two-component response regulator|nr:AraC family transcriptional regulator [Clostridiales bacterium]